MKNKELIIGLLFSMCFAFVGVLNVDVVKAADLENTAEMSFPQKGKGCKVTSSTTIYVASLDKDFVLKPGTYLTVVDPQPHQGIIVVKTRINKKLTQGEIKLDDTNCVPILPQ